MVDAANSLELGPKRMIGANQQQRSPLSPPAAINRVRVERMLKELHAGPPLRVLEDAFSLTEFASGKIAAMEAAVREAVSEQDDEQAVA